MPFGRAALRALTQLVALVHTLEDGTLRLRLCHQNQALLEDLRQEVAAAFTGLAGIVLGRCSGAPALRAFRVGAAGNLDLCPSQTLLAHRCQASISISQNCHAMPASQTFSCLSLSKQCGVRAERIRTQSTRAKQTCSGTQRHMQRTRWPLWAARWRRCRRLPRHSR